MKRSAFGTPVAETSVEADALQTAFRMGAQDPGLASYPAAVAAALTVFPFPTRDEPREEFIKGQFFRVYNGSIQRRGINSSEWFDDLTASEVVVLKSLLNNPTKKVRVV